MKHKILNGSSFATILLQDLLVFKNLACSLRYSSRALNIFLTYSLDYIFFGSSPLCSRFRVNKYILINVIKQETAGDALHYSMIFKIEIMIKI